MSHPFQTIEACSLMDPLPRSVVSLLHGEVRPTCSANGQKVAIIGTLTLYVCGRKKNLNRTLEIDSPFQTLTVGLLVEFID